MEALIFNPSMLTLSLGPPLPSHSGTCLGKDLFPYWFLLISSINRFQDIPDVDIGLFSQRCPLMMLSLLPIINNPPISKLPISYLVWFQCKVAFWSLPAVCFCENIMSSQFIFWFCCMCMFQGDRGGCVGSVYLFKHKCIMFWPGVSGVFFPLSICSGSGNQPSGI